MVLAAAYYLWALQRAFFGSLNEKLTIVGDLERHEVAAFSIMIVIMVLLGIQPWILIDVIQSSAANMVVLLGGG